MAKRVEVDLSVERQAERRAFFERHFAGREEDLPSSEVLPPADLPERPHLGEVCELFFQQYHPDTPDWSGEFLVCRVHGHVWRAGGCFKN